MFSVARAMISGRSTPSELRSSKNASTYFRCTRLWGCLRRSGEVANDLVVYVGDVHDVAIRHSRQLEEPTENVDDEGSEVADVAVVVNRGPLEAYMRSSFPSIRASLSTCPEEC